MSYKFLDRDLWSIANSIKKHFVKNKFKVNIEIATPEDWGFRPTFICDKLVERYVIEITKKPHMEKYFKDFIINRKANKDPVKIYLGIPEQINDEDNTIPLSVHEELVNLHVGVYTVDENGKISEMLKAVDQSLYFNIPKGRKLGKYENDLQESIIKFNNGQIIDALRDITEIVESVISDLAQKASRANKINVTIKELEKFGFEKKISLLSQKQWNGKKQTCYFDSNLSNDFKSFRGARNISHHPRDRNQKARLHEQCIERMYMGVRLVRESLRLMDKM